MIKLTLTTQADAQSVADACHSYLIANDVDYAEDAKLGETKSWCEPTPDGAGGWYIWVTDQLSPVDSRIATLFPVQSIV